MSEEMTEPRWYTVTEVANILSVSPYTVREWLKHGSMDGVKLGKNWRVSKEALTKFVNERHG